MHIMLIDTFRIWMPLLAIVNPFLMTQNLKRFMSECNCNHGECSSDKSQHKHENGECVHPDGTKHTIHEKH